MTLDEARALHPRWRIEPQGLDLVCERGPWCFLAQDAGDAHETIGRYERIPEGVTVTLAEFARGLARPGS